MHLSSGNGPTWSSPPGQGGGVGRRRCLVGGDGDFLLIAIGQLTTQLTLDITAHPSTVHEEGLIRLDMPTFEEHLATCVGGKVHAGGVGQAEADIVQTYTPIRDMDINGRFDR